MSMSAGRAISVMPSMGARGTLVCNFRFRNSFEKKNISYRANALRYQGNMTTAASSNAAHCIPLMGLITAALTPMGYLRKFQRDLYSAVLICDT